MGQTLYWYFPDMRPTPPPIPTYGLYSDGEAQSSAGFVHIETIAIRSSLHDWEIKPHRHDHGIQVLIVKEGHADVTLDGEQFALPPPGFVTVPVGSVHGFRFRPDTVGHIMTLSQDFLTRAHGPEDPLRRWLTTGGHGALPAPAMARIAMLAGEMLVLMQDWQTQPALIHALAEALVRSLPAPQQADAHNRDDRRLTQFRHLIETHLRDHHPLEFYTTSIGCTPRTLSRLCRARLDCSPLDLINRRLALEAQRLLRYTSASVEQVAQELGFGDPSYFSRFYLRMTGHRPRMERDRPAETSPPQG
ncbi:helix-turn-helix domain-containing protein [Novosphingobium rosa]|uniref:helix-turn-helix domain-containing protein n=1 Tax=Novosphingobium rosa TaxID=76978 RepID=UPI000B1DC180|nr:helix-turn-helix domain-containing protein [Novosphingobium rosa]